MHVLARTTVLHFRNASHAKTYGAGCWRRSDAVQLLGAATGFAPHQPDLRPAAGAGRSAHHAILILAKLGRLGAMPISKLADTMVMERTALSRSVGPLERDGLVKIGAGPMAAHAA